MSILCVEDRVLVLGKPCPGTLAFIGNTQFSTGVWFGVILDEPVGRNNGSYGGVEYFKCPKNQGVFVRPCQVTKIANDSDSQLSAHTAPKLFPNYLKDVSTPVSSKKKCSKSSKTDSLVRVAPQKKDGEFGNRTNSIEIEMSGEDKCVFVNQTNANGSDNGGYEVVQYLKNPRHKEMLAKTRQVTKIPLKSNIKSSKPTVSNINPKNLRSSLSSVSTLKSKKCSSKDALTNSKIQQKEYTTKNSIANSSIKVADKDHNAPVTIETISKNMESNCPLSDPFSREENKSPKNCSKKLVGRECFSPELQRSFSKTDKDLTEIKDYITELDEKIRRLKTEKLEKDLKF